MPACNSQHHELLVRCTMLAHKAAAIKDDGTLRRCRALACRNRLVATRMAARMLTVAVPVGLMHTSVVRWFVVNIPNDGMFAYVEH